jgi:D-sedoheptulose 7-phosphate isomerase
MRALSESQLDARWRVERALGEAASALARLRADASALDAIARAGALFADALVRGGRVHACGNGGSLCDAMHFAEELSGRFRRDRRALAASAIADAAHLTCTANDFGYDEVFARWLEAHGARGDALLAISTSGESANVLRAAAKAREIGMGVVALTGRTGTSLARAAHVAICTPGGRWSDRVQELHIKVVHVLVELVESRLFPELCDAPPGARGDGQPLSREEALR